MLIHILNINVLHEKWCLNVYRRTKTNESLPKVTEAVPVSKASKVSDELQISQDAKEQSNVNKNLAPPPDSLVSRDEGNTDIEQDSQQIDSNDNATNVGDQPVQEANDISTSLRDLAQSSEPGMKSLLTDLADSERWMRRCNKWALDWYTGFAVIHSVRGQLMPQPLS